MSGKHPLFLAFLLVFISSACKKGEDDPILSLRTRKARLTGEWRLTEGNLAIGTTDVTHGTRYNQVYSFNESRYNMTETGPGQVPVPSSGAYLLNLTFDKKGNFSLTEQLRLLKLSASGTWDFNTGIGKGKKKKEDLAISLNDVTGSRTGGYHLFNQNSMAFTYSIKELRNKRLVLKAEIPTYVDVEGATQTFYGEFTFIQ